ncbi:MAG: hypothetical protein WEA61_07600 [Anaerolineales bacterium]
MYRFAWKFNLSLLLIVTLTACTQPQAPVLAPSTNSSALPSVEGVIKGYGISPLGFPADYSRYPDFLTEVGSLPNGGVMFNGAWRMEVAGGSVAGQVPQTAIGIVREAANYGYTPIIVFGWRSDDGSLHISIPSNAADDWSNEDAKALFKQMLVDFAAGYYPPFLFLGNESDAYYISNAEDYARWVAFYNEAYDAIKAVSPETMVGPIFQYERLSGQGTFNQWTTPQWGALEAHDLSKVDIVGFTLYPWLGVSTPEEVPDAYFAPLVQRIGDKPVAITETGWPGDGLGLLTAWEASPEAQIRYIDTLRRILPELNVRILNWLHLNQMVQTPENLTFWQAFSSISLRDFEGSKRPIYDAWVEFQP